MSICVYYSASRNRKSLDSRLALDFAVLNPTYGRRAGIGRGKMPRLQGLSAQLILFGRVIPPYNYNHCVWDADLRPLQCPPQSWDGTAGAVPYICVGPSSRDG